MTRRTAPAPPRRRALVALACFALVLSACGLRPGVADEAAQGGNVSADGTDGGGSGGGGGTGTGSESAGDQPGDLGTTGDSNALGDPGANPGDPGADSGGSDPSNPGSVPPGGTATTRAGTTGPATTALAGPGNRTGIDAKTKTIKIGIHAPVTGAAPFPQSTFETGRKIYWDFVKSKGGILGGFNVEVVFEDDEFTPSVAVQKCKKMVEQDKVFLLIGGGGAEQITACAKYANSVNVPYLSAGVNESGLSTLKTYFAISETYAQQSPQLAQLAANVYGKQDAAVVVGDSAGFEDAFTSISRELPAKGVKVVFSRRIPSSLSQSQALQLAGDLRRSGAKTVYFLAAPASFIYLAQAGNSQGYIPQYIGPGVSAGLNTVANLGCPGIGKASFFSPFPGLDAIDRLDADYKVAYRQYSGGSNPDDIGIALWGLNKTIRVMMEATGPSISRESFIATLQSGKEFATGVYPALRYGAGKHFGGTTVHRLEASCGDRQYLTKATFASSF